jgi:CNT family concentrative nucleoside transporter
MTSGFSTIAGSVLAAYINLGVPATNLVTSSVMSIPASMAISKLRIPEIEEPVTRGRVTVDRGLKDAPVSQQRPFKVNSNLKYVRQMRCTPSVRVPFSA